MKIKDLGILTDENIQPEVILYLRSEGFDVKDVKELKIAGTSDLRLLELATAENRIILTHDSDFGKIVFTKDVTFVGIVYLRPGHFNADFTISSLNALFSHDFELDIPFIITAENTGETVKIRKRIFK